MEDNGTVVECRPLIPNVLGLNPVISGFIIPPSKKRGYIGVTVSVGWSEAILKSQLCRSVGSNIEAIFCPAYFLQTTGWNF